MFRPSLESLETRETPASFRLQIMFNPAPPTVADDVVVDGRIITAENFDSARDSSDYSAIVFVGGWGSSMYQ